MTATPWAADRRVLPDRRAARRFRFRERRRGYDRRLPSRLDAALLGVRRLPVALTLATVFVAMNLLDLVATTVALGRGAVELNPVMAALLGGGTGGAVVLKLAVTIPVLVGFLGGRRHRTVALGMVAVTALLALVGGYHVLNLALSG